MFHHNLEKIKIIDQKTMIQRQIDLMNNQVNNILYKLYGLTEKEIKIVEGGE